MSRPTLIISPYSRPLKSLGINPKNFLQWEIVVDGLLARFPTLKILQVCYKSGEKGLIDSKIHPDTDYLFFSSVHDLGPYFRMPIVWASVDNFFPHLCAVSKGPPGVVIFSKSDPSIFGYPTNHNLHSIPTRFRPNQFDFWEACNYDPDAFPSANSVIDAIGSFIVQRLDASRT